MCYIILGGQSFVDLDEIGMVPSVLLNDVKKTATFLSKMHARWKYVIGTLRHHIKFLSYHFPTFYDAVITPID